MDRLVDIVPCDGAGRRCHNRSVGFFRISWTAGGAVKLALFALCGDCEVVASEAVDSAADDGVEMLSATFEDWSVWKVMQS